MLLKIRFLLFTFLSHELATKENPGRLFSRKVLTPAAKRTSRSKLRAGMLDIHQELKVPDTVSF